MFKRIIKLLISLLYFFITGIINFARKILNKKVPGTYAVLYYHEIPERFRDNFSDQMRCLVELANPVKADFRGKIEDGKRFIAVTFDDAFESVLKNGLAVLHEYKIPATVFVPTAFLGQPPGWDTKNNDYLKNERIMSVEQLKALDKSLVTIGSHTRTHPPLSDLDEISIREELSGSKTELEVHLGVTIDLLAFPYGSYNESVVAIAKETGYRRVYKITPEFTFDKDGFAVGRIAAHPDDWLIEFKLKVIGCYNWVSLIGKIKRRLMQRSAL
jgi:peptidoglycan/xylan/chitin deacetylase (PgdA/CDA1 family)